MNSAGGKFSLPPHQFAIALISPQIAPNTGNIARLCVATGTHLHLVRPLGFVLTDKQLKRSAMDYWPRVKLTVHDDVSAFMGATQDRRHWLFETSDGAQTIWETDFVDGDVLVFGPETGNTPRALREAHPARIVQIPQVHGERCLNLAVAAGIGIFAALRHALHQNG